MPFTPFHLGPGALFKAVGGARFSFLIFSGSQVLIDIEPLVRILRGDAVLHGPSHTVLGATVIGLIAGAVGRPISEIALGILRIAHEPISWAVAFASAFLGTYSHVALDAVMHTDMRPLVPLADGNGMLGIVSVAALHMICISSALIAGSIWALHALCRIRSRTG